MIDAVASRTRSMQWLCFKYQVSGELYFEVAYGYTVEDVWQTQFNFGGNGDGTLLYPGTPVKIGGSTNVPVASMRFKLIREGYEDYEYLKMMADLGLGALAESIVDSLFPNPYTVTVSDTAIYQARATMAAAIIAAQSSAISRLSGSLSLAAVLVAFAVFFVFVL